MTPAQSCTGGVVLLSCADAKSALDSKAKGRRDVSSPRGFGNVRAGAGWQ